MSTIASYPPPARAITGEELLAAFQDGRQIALRVNAITATATASAAGYSGAAAAARDQASLSAADAASHDAAASASGQKAALAALSAGASLQTLQNYLAGLPATFQGPAGGNILSVASFATMQGAGALGQPRQIPSTTLMVMTSHHTKKRFGRAFYERVDTLTDANLAALPLTTFKAVDENGNVTRWILYSGSDWEYESLGAQPFFGAISAAAVAANAADCSPAFAELHALNAFLGGTSTGYVPGGRVMIGRGNFYHSQDHNVHALFAFEGAGGGAAGGAANTTLVFAPNSHGVIVNRHNTDRDQVSGAFTQGAADGASYKKLKIQSLGGNDPTKHGVWMRARATLEDLQIVGFPGNNLNIVANSSTDGTLGTNLSAGNANDFQLKRVVLQGSGRHAAYISGIDVNAAATEALEVLSAGCGGIIDLNYLGNTHTAWAVHSTGSAGLGRCGYNGRAYHLISATDGAGAATQPGTNNFVWYDLGATTDMATFPAWDASKTYITSAGVLCTNPNSRTVFQGGYVEVGACGISHVASPSMVNGGTLQTEFTRYTPFEFIASGVGAFRSNNGGYGSLRYTAPYGAAATTSFGSYAYAAFGEEMLEGGGGAFCTFMRAGSATGSDFRGKLLPNDGGVYYDFANATFAIKHLGYGATDTFGRSSPVVRDTAAGNNNRLVTVLPFGLLLRYDGNGRVLQQNFGKPPAGQDYAAGEFSLTSAVENCIGWFCVAGSTLTAPGTGALQADAVWLKAGAFFIDASTVAAIGQVPAGACSQNFTVNVPGAAIRDAVIMSSERSLGGMQLVAWVDSPGVVKFYAFNPVGAPALDNRNYFIRVEKM